MKVKIYQDGCIECGGCEDECPEVFVVESGEKAAIVEKYRAGGPDEGEVEDDLKNCVDSAIEVCPVDVISKS